MNPAKNILWCCALALAICAVFFQTLNFEFITASDVPLLLQNPFLISGLSLSSIRGVFLNFYGSSWIPLNWISHMAVFEFFGSDAAYHHLANLFLHLLNTFLLLLFLKKLTGKFWLSFYVAAFFALHPLHVESVAWITERKTLLGAAFWFLACLRYLDYVRTKKRLHYLGALFAFALGLMTQPAMVLFPVIFILIDRWPLNRAALEKSRRRLYIEKLPFFLMSGIVSVLTLFAQRSTASLNTVAVIPFDIRFANAALSGMKYLRKTIWPFDLSIFYPYESPTAILIKGSLAAAVLAGITIWLLRQQKQRPYLLFGWLWYWVTLLPTLGIISFGGYSMGDRCTYVPLIGIFFMLTWGVRYLILEWKNTQTLFRVGGLSLICLTAVLSWAQTGYWKNSQTVFEHAVQVTPKNYLAHIHLGDYFTVQKDYARAARHYEAALSIRPDLGTMNNLGSTYMMLDRLNEALGTFQLVISQDPGQFQSWANLGIIHIRKENFTEAVNSFAEAIQLNPDAMQAYLGMVEALLGAGRVREAESLLSRQLKQRPDHPGLLYWRDEIKKAKV